MVKALFDTNILIDYLRGLISAREEMDRYDDVAISVVTWMEVLVGTPEGTEEATRGFLERFELVEIDRLVADAAIRLRRSTRMKLPDAVVWASASTRGLLLVTRNTKDFPSDDPGVRIPYALP